MEEIEKEWKEYKLYRLTTPIYEAPDKVVSKKNKDITYPEPSNLFISTKTHIIIMKEEINVMDIFLNTPIISYYSQKEGFVKKQCLCKCFDKTTFDKQEEEIKKQPSPCKEVITTHIDNPDGRLKFKDVRKVTVGVSKHDFTKLNNKDTRLFYNCCILIIRIFNEKSSLYEEYHVKMFKTGKIEIPGTKDDDMFQKLLNYIKNYLNQEIVSYQPILCNTNFSCNYNIHRDELYELLTNKYNIQSSYYPSSHHAIQCRMYYKCTDNTVEYIDGYSHAKINNSTKLDRAEYNNDKDTLMVSCMIFRTGSVLISTRKSMEAIIETYNLLVKIFKDDFELLNHGISDAKITKSTEIKTLLKQIIIYQNE
jgi:TATA-box binding protein (TBP) (component of TFIID and TFIIIB)